MGKLKWRGECYKVRKQIKYEYGLTNILRGSMNPMKSARFHSRAWRHFKIRIT